MTRAIVFLLLLVGCADLTPAQLAAANLFTACKSVSSAEQALRPWKARMSHAQVTAVRDALTVAQPICGKPTAEVVDLREAVRKVKESLAELLAVKQGVVQ